MTTLFAYPSNAAFGRVLPKSKIYEHTRPTTAVKELFVRQIEQIVWQYKLAPETINVQGTAAVPEIQVFHITLKTGELKPEVLRCIDQVIPYPLVFELHHEDNVKGIAAYKRPSEADAAKRVISPYFATDWLPEGTPRQSLPVVFDLEALYAQLLAPLLPYPPRQGESLQAQVDRMDQIGQLQRELERCETRLAKEKQFNRKVAMNAERRELRQAVKALIDA
ncbi:MULTISPECIES: DUF4391 domain-containing protein [Desulfovibrio]|uniref:DUF4391 domain-containing protein n=1 Tax=Desulfovibrio desulfuricans TaxID=876 RepID=A0AA94L330_DESDE|nr:MULTISPECIES: DUF4391 domain-containing protein [Desulfovibrio]ATD82429.1 DUF4391 domain-containing protein [Desulfovibrio sp. G11]SFW66172.1 protein of unknown function [Desulfovibrio desulfuricans]SPD35218.1 Protein of unknown function (DUF4391) [Desulfovibrio sp. G11]